MLFFNLFTLSDVLLAALVVEGAWLSYQIVQTKYRL